MTALPCPSGNGTGGVRGHQLLFCIPGSRGPQESPRGCDAGRHRCAAHKTFKAQKKSCLEEFKRLAVFQHMQQKADRNPWRGSNPGLNQGPAVPHPGPHFVLATQCLQHGCLSPTCSSTFKASAAKLVGALTWISHRSEEGNGRGLDHTQLPRASLLPPSC